MPAKICIIQGHPDSTTSHFCHALAAAYAEGAHEAGHTVTTIDVGQLDVPFLRNRQEWMEGAVSDDLAAAQRTIEQAGHIVIIFPLWLGDMPALLKAFLEQVLRPGFAVPPGEGKPGMGLLKGRSAHVIATMGMPGFVYRWYYGGHALRLIQRSILNFVGISPVRGTTIGMVEGGAEHRNRWLQRVRVFGRSAG